MEQKDFLLREIEKIGQIISYIRSKLFGGENTPAIITEKERRELSVLLLNEIRFDLEKFVNLDSEAAIEYISNFNGFNIDNLDFLAELLFKIGTAEPSEHSVKYLEKSLLLYELAVAKSKTFLFEREMKIQMLKNAL